MCIAIIVESIPVEATRPAPSRTAAPSGSQKGTYGVSTNGVTAKFMFFDRLFGYSRSRAKVPGRTFFPNLSKFSTFAAAPLVLTPFARNQGSTRSPTRSPTWAFASGPRCRRGRRAWLARSRRPCERSGGAGAALGVP